MAFVPRKYQTFTTVLVSVMVKCGLALGLLQLGCRCSYAQSDREFSTEGEALAHVADISFDERIDDPDFAICDSTRVLQYYNFGRGLQYEGEKIALVEYFKKNYAFAGGDKETGFITIRFVVNCKGRTGRFRIQKMDMDFRSKEFNSRLIDHLLSLTQKLPGWIVGKYKEQEFDYYQYLTFKIIQDNLIEIMP